MIKIDPATHNYDNIDQIISNFESKVSSQMNYTSLVDFCNNFNKISLSNKAQIPPEKHQQQNQAKIQETEICDPQQQDQNTNHYQDNEQPQQNQHIEISNNNEDINTHTSTQQSYDENSIWDEIEELVAQNSLRGLELQKNKQPYSIIEDLHILVAYKQQQKKSQQKNQDYNNVFYHLHSLGHAIPNRTRQSLRNRYLKNITENDLEEILTYAKSEDIYQSVIEFYKQDDQQLYSTCSNDKPILYQKNIIKEEIETIWNNSQDTIQSQNINSIINSNTPSQYSINYTINSESRNSSKFTHINNKPINYDQQLLKEGTDYSKNSKFNSDDNNNLRNFQGFQKQEEEEIELKGQYQSLEFQQIPRQLRKNDFNFNNNNCSQESFSFQKLISQVQKGIQSQYEFNTNNNQNIPPIDDQYKHQTIQKIIEKYPKLQNKIELLESILHKISYDFEDFCQLKEDKSSLNIQKVEWTEDDDQFLRQMTKQTFNFLIKYKGRQGVLKRIWYLGLEIPQELNELI